MFNNGRGRLYVDRDVQCALVWQLFRHWVLFIAILTGMLLTLEALQPGSHPSLRAFLHAAWDRHAPLILVVVALFPVFVYDSIKLSHRFVGPIIRLRRAMREAVLGQGVKRLEFRKGDFWQDMALSFNALMEHLPQDDAHQDEDEPGSLSTSRELALAGTAADETGGA